MTTKHWSDFHAWPVLNDALAIAQGALSAESYAALSSAREHAGVQGFTPRVAIEDAALAMPPALAIQFLAAVYELDHAGGEKVLNAIRGVRGHGGRK